jgi:hypothetical protein
MTNQLKFCDDALATDHGAHPCSKRGGHRVHSCDCDLGLSWIRNADQTADITGHLHRISANMRVSHE